MDDYERYTELLVQKEEVKRQAEETGRAYLRQFGQLIEDTFAVNIEAIKIKKMIALYMQAINRGELPNEADIESVVAKQMQPYYSRLQNQRDEIQDAHKVKPLDTYDLEQSKTIYRRLMKLLHPDVSNLTQEYPEFMEFFAEIQLAYKCLNWERLQELEVLVYAKLKELGIDTVAILIEDLEEKIKKLEDTINLIMDSAPYTYKDILETPAKTLEHNDYLQAQYDESVSYRDELLEKLNEIKEGC